MKDEIFEQLKKAVQEFDSNVSKEMAQKAIDEQIDPLETLDVLTSAIREIGDQFEAGEVFLPELIAAAEAMSSATAPLEEEIRRQGKTKESLGKVVIGTVYGDIHDIGKNMVATLFKASGFDVIDCGSNVESGTFLEEIQKQNADILAMSALLTTTAPEQRKVIRSLSEAGLREKVKVIVGGGGITKQFADEIGADGYDATASGAVRLGTQLMGRSEG